MSDSNGKTDWNQVLWIGGAAIVICFSGYALYLKTARNWHIESVMQGPLRGNKATRIYHVPTCPQYNSIGADDLRLFETIEQARSAGYRQAKNCGDDFHIREINETEDPETPEHPSDPQYR
jgi:hypothetical protein